jgi:tetratricopeptide (TPR) repeat protein
LFDFALDGPPESANPLFMPSYLWSGKAPSGRDEVERVSAETPEAAREILEARGWTDLRQHTTEIHDFVQQQVRAATDPDFHAQLTPKEDLAYLHGKGPGLWQNWLKSLREANMSILFLAICSAVAVYYRARWEIAIFGGLLLVVVFLFPALHLWFGRTKNLFRELHTARNWRRWDEVLALLARLERAGKSTKIGIGDSSMARYRALALAGLGRLDEAVHCFQAAADQAKMPQWMFQTHLAGIYSAAKQYDKAVECHRLALGEASDKSVVWIDLGVLLVQRFDCPDEARQLLAQAEAAQLSEQARNWLPYLRGAIAFRENDFAAADKLMRQALAGFEKAPPNKHYIFEPVILISKGYLAISSAALGQRDRARKYHAESAEYLAAIGLDELLERYHGLMGKG